MAAIVAGAAGGTLVSSIAPALVWPRDLVVVSLLALFVGSLVPASLVAWSWPAEIGRARGSRIAALGFAVACGATAIWLISSGFSSDWASLLPLAGGAMVGALQGTRPTALARLSLPKPRSRAAITAFTILATLVLGHETIVFAVDEYRPQQLPRWEMGLVAAYPFSMEAPPGGMPTVVVDRSGAIGEVVTVGGARFNLHASDALRIPSREVRRVRWIEEDGDAFIALRLSGDLAAAFEERMHRRMSQYDVVVIDEAPLLAIFYEPGWARPILWSSDRRLLRRVYAHLAGEPAP